MSLQSQHPSQLLNHNIATFAQVATSQLFKVHLMLIMREHLTGIAMKKVLVKN